MNFTCISPKDNGYNYNVRYNEPIIIPENATVSMNFAQFERDNKIRFTEAQTIKVVPERIFPYWDWYNLGAGKVDGAYRINEPRNDTDLLFSIPAGEYSLNDGSVNSLQRKICESLGSGSTTGVRAKGFLGYANTGLYNIGPETNNNSMVLPDYSLIVPPIDRVGQGLEIGFTHRNIHLNMKAHATHKVGMEETGADTGIFVKNADVADVALGANGLPAQHSYNSYIMGDNNYFHIGMNLNQYIQPSGYDSSVVMKDGGFDSLGNANTLVFSCNKDIDQQEGNVFVGLWSQQIAGVGIGTADESTIWKDATEHPLNSYINRAHMKTKHDGGATGYYPYCFFGIEITGGAITTDGSVEAGKPRMINIISFGNGGLPIATGSTHMKVLESIPLDSLRDPHDNSPVSIGFQTYLDKNNKNFYHHGNDIEVIHTRVFLNIYNGGHKIIYDTNTKYPHHSQSAAAYSSGFFNVGNANSDPATINLAEAQGQTPFTPIICATKQGEGAMVDYSFMSNVDDTTNDNRMPCLLEEYHLELSEQLGKLFLPSSGTTVLSTKYPSYCCLDDVIRYYNTELSSQGGFKGITMDDNEFIYNKNFIIPQFRTDQFSVVLNNLPIKSFKNTSDKSKSGYRKPIVSLVPHPFSGAEENNQQGGVIQGSYQPSYGITNRLSNQAITTNNFDILILDLETDKPAEQLTKSVINFTIDAE